MKEFLGQISEGIPRIIYKGIFGGFSEKKNKLEEHRKYFMKESLK